MEFLMGIAVTFFLLTGVLTWLVIFLSFVVWYFAKKEW